MREYYGPKSEDAGPGDEDCSLALHALQLRETQADALNRLEDYLLELKAKIRHPLDLPPATAHSQHLTQKAQRAQQISETEDWRQSAADVFTVVIILFVFVLLRRFRPRHENGGYPDTGRAPFDVLGGGIAFDAVGRAEHAVCR